MNKFGRVLTAMITPFKVDGSLNFEIAEKLASYLVHSGSDSIILCGTTGESPTLTPEEEYELCHVVKSAVPSRISIIVGSGSNSTQEAILATKRAKKLNLDGTLQVVPYYNKPPQEGLYHHFKTIADAAPDLPLILYNIPGRTSVNLLPETVAKLSKIPNIIGIKEASGNLDQVSEIIRITPPEFAIYSGDDSLTLPMLSLGCTGVVSVASHLVGEEIQNMIQLFSNGNVKEASEIHLNLFPLFKALFVTTNPIPIKAALSLQGWPVEHTRSPLCSLPPKLKDELSIVMSRSILIKSKVMSKYSELELFNCHVHERKYT